MSLVVFTGLCGLLAAPGHIHPVLGFTAILCIALGAGGAGALNQWWEADLDAGMKRTAERPLPGGPDGRARTRAISASRCRPARCCMMGLAVGWLAAVDPGGLDRLLRGGLHHLAQAAHAAEHRHRRRRRRLSAADRLGRGDRRHHAMPVLLFAIIFMWTPPHFWALALFVKTDYAKVGIPMLPVVAGEQTTRRQILVYSVLLLAAQRWRRGGSAGPGAIYGVAALALSRACSWRCRAARSALRTVRPKATR